MNVRLLLSTQRSGSHFLKSFIENHFPGVICSGELLEQPVAFRQQLPILPNCPEFPHFWTWYEHEAAAGNISVTPDQRIAAFAAYLSALAAKVTPNDLLMDIKYNSIRSLSGYWDSDYGSSDFTSFITNRNIPVLHLIRKNILRVIVSNKLAQQTGVWHRMTERPANESLPKIRLSPKAVLFEIRYAFKLANDYRSRFRGYSAYEEIIYEDFVREQNKSETGIHARSLTLFLQKPLHHMNQSDIRFKKTTPDDPSEVVENWQEVVRAVHSTEHAWMTDPPLLAAA